MAEVLAVKCKSCGNPTPSPIGASRQSFATMQLTDISFPCQSCGVRSSYDRPDFFFAEVVEDQPGTG
jgi:hypothetical protein